MSDETNETSEQPKDETTEGQAAETAGPVAEEAPSSSQAAGEDTSSAPPADEAAETSDPAPVAEEQGIDAAPVDEAAAAGSEGETPADAPQRERARDRG